MNTRLRGLTDRVVARIRESVRRYPIVTAVVPILVLALAATLVLRPPSGPGPSPSGQVSQASPVSPGASPGATASAAPAPTETPEPWEALVLDPAVVAATISPDRESRSGLASTARFTLRSLDGTPAAELAAGVTVEPAVAFAIIEGATADIVTLEPKEPLAEGQTYRLELRTPTGALGGAWAFRTQRPPRIVGTLPGDQTTEVPVRTGIEVTFDQDGTTGFEPRFHIEPAVPGRFELHERTWVFVPDVALKPTTMYEVTVDPGVGLADSDLTLETGITFRFETDTAAPPEIVVRFTAPMAAVRVGEQPTLPIYGASRADRNGGAAIASLPTEIFALPDLKTTLEAVARLTGPDSWGLYAPDARVATDDLVRIAKLDAPVLVDQEGARMLAIPIDLDPGAYLVVLPRREVAQLVLQVTNLGVYALSTETDTLVWLNNLRTVNPVAGAAVASIDGRRFGVTNESGVARFATPPELRTTRPDRLGADDDDAYYDYWYVPDPRLIAVTAPDGRWVVAGLGSPVGSLDGAFDNAASRAAEPSQRWWLLLNTDRDQYRETDTIHAWGLVRSRDDGALPAGVRLALYPINEDFESGVRGAPIASVPVRLNRSGAFAADIDTSSLPRSYYRLDLEVGGGRAQSTWIEVADIRKPAYRVDVATDRYAYRDGEAIEVAIRASFFDGSSAPGIDLRVSTRGPDVTVTTDRTGAARVTVHAEFSSDAPTGWNGQVIDVTPVRPEEGEISGSADVVVFPSDAWITGTSRLTGTTLTIDGTVSRVALKAIDAAHADGSWDWDAVVAGRPFADRVVSANVVRLRPVRVDLGTHYDYLEKKVVHAYRWDTVRETVGTFLTRSKADGTYRLTATVPSAKDGYEIVLRASDLAGRPVRTDDYARARIDAARAARGSYLVPSDTCGFSDSITVGLDGTARVSMHDGDGRIAAGRFLFLVGNRGLRDLTVTDSPTFARVLRDRDLPGFTIRAVQVTGDGYATADAQVDVDAGALTVQVGLRPDRTRYEPGDRVTVEVTTLGPDGRPVAADVIVQGVDEKLFAIGAAHEADILGDLYQWVGPGFLQSYASHRIPLRPFEGGCGATGGGGRDSFGDVVTAQLVRTGNDGRATVSFDLLDDLTSWHLSAMAITDGLRAGRASVLIPAGLAFFVETVLAPEYLVGEAPVLRVRAYGDALEAGDAVSFTVSAPSLGLAETTVEGRAFEAVRVQLPALLLGEHRIRVAGRGPGQGLRDAVIRSVGVIPTRLSSLMRTFDPLSEGYVPQGGNGLTTYAITDMGRGSLVSTLLDLASTTSARFDRLAAADAARQLLIDEFGFDPRQLRDPGFEPGLFQQSGIALLPYASQDPELSALTALIASDRMNLGALRSYLEGRADEGENQETRIMALAGLAGLGEDVLERLLAFTTENLTIRESLWLALGLAAAGDENGARSIERALLAAHGERYGPWVRLAVGANTEDTLNAARLLLVLSARLGEPIARDVLRYIDDNESFERAMALERLAYVMAGLDRLPRVAGEFAWTVDGERHEVVLKPGATSTLVFTGPQRESLVLEPIAGQLAVVTSWSGLGAGLPHGGGVTITRTVTPANDARDDQLVRIVITVDLGSVPYDGCWQIRDVAPSGLAPIERGSGWPDEDYGSYLDRPYDFDGQTVLWCLSFRSPVRSATYIARVVSPGTYTWEPAILQAVDAPELGAATEATIFTIR